MQTSNYGKSVQQYAVGKVFEDSVKHTSEKAKHLYDVIRNNEPRENTNLGGKIDFALLSKKTYENSRQRREVEGFDILPEFTSPDRTVYRHNGSGKVIIAFRGTTPNDWKGGIESKGFRDLTTDVILAFGEQDHSHRFKNAERVTNRVIQKFGRENVIATGHSLGGSQALHVSNKFGIHAEVYNPHIDWESAVTRTNYYHAALHVNRTDPVAAFYPGATFQSVDARYNKRAAPFLGQHSIDNFIWSTLQKKSTNEKPKSDAKPNGILGFINRPQQPTTENAQKSVTPHHPAYLDCSRMPLYMQIQYGCTGGNKAKGGSTGRFSTNH